jgi:septum formation protein
MRSENGNIAIPRPVHHPVVLASSSASRRQLLARLGLIFDYSAPDIDERPRHGETALALVRRLAGAKAVAVAGRYPAATVIGSDQVALNGDAIMGKPGTRENAVTQLQAASGRSVSFLTSLCVLQPGSQKTIIEVVETEVVFRRLSITQIESYVDAEQPFDCAGSFKAEGLGIALFERISSNDPTALLGLPLIALVGMLNACGLDVFALSPNLSRST